MELFLQTLLRLSLLGSLLALALTALRPLLRGRVSRRASYYLWLLVLLRLCVPAGIGLSVPVAAEVPDVPAAPEAPDVPWTSENSDSAPEAPRPEGYKALPSSPLPDIPGAPELPDAPDPPASPPDWLRDPALWALAWWLGMLASIGWFALGYLRVTGRVLRSARPADGEAYAILHELNPKGGVQLAESPVVGTPLLLGVVRPTIVLPAGITDPARLRDILAHELIHVRRHDLLFKWFAAVVTSLHWFNPMMLLVRREIGRCCELACDESVMGNLDEAGRRHYGETLLALAAYAPKGLGPLAVTLCEEKKQLKERLVCIVKYKKSGPLVLFLSLLLAAVVGACSLVTGVKPVASDVPEPPPEEDLEPDKALSDVAEELYQHITGAPDGDYDFTVQVKYSNKTDEFHITPENGYNVAFVGNYLTFYVWEEAEVSEWVGRDYLGTVLTLASADGKSSIRCRSADDVVELVRDGKTRYAHVRDPEAPEDPDPHLMYNLFSFLLTIPDDAFSSSVWDGTANGSLPPEEAAAALAESVAERYRNTPDWLDWKPLDFQVESAKVIDVYKGAESNFCFWGTFCLQLDDPSYIHWQAGSGLDDPIAAGSFAGYYHWGREILVEKNSAGDWYIADYGTGGASVNLPGWSMSSGLDNSLDKATLEELADLFFLTEGWSHDYLLPIYMCQCPAEELAGLNDLLDRRTEAEAADLCRALTAYLNTGYGASYEDITLRSVEDLNALLDPAYQAYTADVPPLWQ